jgi:hypothetical protein
MIGLGNLLGDTGPSEPRCSRAGCDTAATTAVNWRNPKIHSADRVKVWLACDDHADYLGEFLSARNFPVVITPMGTSVSVIPDSEAADASDGKPSHNPAVITT